VRIASTDVVWLWNIPDSTNVDRRLWLALCARRASPDSHFWFKLRDRAVRPSDFLWLSPSNLLRTERGLRTQIKVECGNRFPGSSYLGLIVPAQF